MNRLTEERYWSDGYRKRGSIVPISLDGSTNRCNLKIYELLDSQGLPGKRVLEVGGGGSSWLAYLAMAFPSSTFTGLDYSPTGCELLANYAQENGLTNLDYRCADFFATDSSIGQFDLLYSLGVVEHFSDLSHTVSKFWDYLAPGGVMVTVIPNMAGVIGHLTRLFNRKVYDIHVPYDLKALVAGHVDAGMSIVRSGYICSTNFGVLSSCFTEERGLGYWTYKWLTRVSKLLWLFESRFFDLPRTAYMAPYSYVIARVDTRPASEDR